MVGFVVVVALVTVIAAAIQPKVDNSYTYDVYADYPQVLRDLDCDLRSDQPCAHLIHSTTPIMVHSFGWASAQLSRPEPDLLQLDAVVLESSGANVLWTVYPDWFETLGFELTASDRSTDGKRLVREFAGEYKGLPITVVMVFLEPDSLRDRTRMEVTFEAHLADVPDFARTARPVTPQDLDDVAPGQ